jgi:hypothetical protein
MPNDIFHLVFTEEQLSVIDQTLQAAPYRVAAPLIAEINRQLQALRDRSPENRQRIYAEAKQQNIDDAIARLGAREANGSFETVTPDITAPS